MKTIYKRTSTGSVQTWAQERNGSCYRTILNGKTIGAWVQAEATNVGRSNQRDATAQALFEMEANYKKKLELDYHESVNDIDKPLIFKPMLAHKYEGWPGHKVFSQPKLDGIRCIATSSGLFSRNGKPLLGVPHIVAALAPAFAKNPDLIFDGELYNHDYKDDFNSIVSAVKKQDPDAEAVSKSAEVVQYHVYDLPSSMDQKFTDRSLAAYNALQHVHGTIRLVPTSIALEAEDLDALYAEYLEQGYEGQMVRLNKPYEQKRSKFLLKRKEFVDEEYIVIDIREGVGNWAGYAKRITLQVPDGGTFGAGVKGNQEYCRTILANKHLFIGKPATVRYFSLTPDGVPRFPVVYQFDRQN